MKKLLLIPLIISIFFLPGCFEPSEKELIELKARVASLEEQLSICKKNTEIKNEVEWDGTEVNHNNNTVLKP